MHSPASTVASEIVRCTVMRPMIAPSTAINSTKVMTAIASRASCESSRDTNTATITNKGTQAIESLNKARGARDVRSANTNVMPRIPTENARSTSPSLNTAIEIRDTTIRISSSAVPVGAIDPLAERRPLVAGAPLGAEVDRGLLVVGRAVRSVAAALGSLLIHG